MAGKAQMQRGNSDPHCIRSSASPVLPYSAARPTVAVLPLIDLDETARQQGLGCWLADDLIHYLSRFRQFAVVARRTSFAARPDHERPFQADYLVRGGVRMAGAECEVEVILVGEARNEVLWRKCYRQAPVEPLQIEDELAQAVATELAVEIGSADPARMAPEPFSQLNEAALLVQRYERNANDQARRIARRLCRDERHAARAHAILARSHHLDWRYRWSADPEAALRLSIEHGETAVALDPMDAAGHAEVAHGLLHRREHDAALAAYRRALELNPNDCDILADFADCLIHTGDPASAIELLQLTLSLNPRDGDCYRWLLAGAIDDQGDPETAVRVIAQMSTPWEAERHLASCLARLGRIDAAKASAVQVLSRHPGFSIDHWRTVLPTRDEAAREPFFEGLARAGLN
jgi:TolB-like protein/Flp pilus assembly protein TadD